jgi:hypothetical protein
MRNWLGLTAFAKLFLLCAARAAAAGAETKLGCFDLI